MLINVYLSFNLSSSCLGCSIDFSSFSCDEKSSGSLEEMEEIKLSIFCCWIDCSSLCIKLSERFESYIFLIVEFGLQILSLYLFVVTFHTFLLQLFCLIHLFVVVLNHLLIGLCVDWRLSQGLLASPLLDLYDNFSLFILSDILSNRFIMLHLLSGPPKGSFLIENLEVLSFQNLELNLLFKHEKSRFPLRKVDVARVCLHNSISQSLNSSNNLLFLNHLFLNLKYFSSLTNSCNHDLPFLLGNDDSITLIMLIGNKTIWGLYNWFSSICLHLFRQILKFFLVFFIILP